VVHRPEGYPGGGEERLRELLTSSEVPAMTQLESPSAGPAAGPALTADEREELLRLRREVASALTGRRPRRTFRWRSLIAVVLIVLGCVLAPVAGVAVWVDNQVSDTDRFVRTVSPLVRDPDIQNALRPSSSTSTSRASRTTASTPSPPRGCRSRWSTAWRRSRRPSRPR
jgi:hypothetical protein